MTLLIIILLFVAAIICKFIYDSFLTNNTERNWEKYKSEYPQKAMVLENSSPFNLNPNAKLRTDGYYLSYYDVPDFEGNLVKVPCILIFNPHNLVAQYRHEGAEQILEARSEEVRDLLIEMSFEKECETSFESSKYSAYNGMINFTFFDGKEYAITSELKDILEYVHWNGTIIHNGLIMSVYKRDYNYAEKDYTVEKIFKELKFEFKQTKLS